MVKASTISRWVLLLGLVIIVTTSQLVTLQSRAFAAETQAQCDARMKWWREGRFGLFIHWGPVSLTGKEISWSRANTNPRCPNKGETPAAVYDNLYKEFNPIHFDAADWVRIAREAGTKYMVLTAKHCDGFMLWHSKIDQYNIRSSPFGTDVCRELTEAARQQRMRIGWYFSPEDWRDPDFRTERNAAFLGRMQPELREVLGNYGKIDLIWFDWDGGDALYDQERTYRIVKGLQPGIVINNRLDLGPTDSNRKIQPPYADYCTPEQELGSYDDQHPWESCMTLGTQWAWKPNDQIKSVNEVIRILANCAGGDGNLLLNVGPMPDGRIEPRQVEVLQGVGKWLRQSGESIYGTRGGPFKPGDYGACTRKGKTIYLHILKWPEGALRLPQIAARVKRARILSGGMAEVRQSSEALEILVPARSRVSPDTVVALELDRPAATIPAVAVEGATARR